MAVDCFSVGLFKRIYLILVLCGLTLCHKYDEDRRCSQPKRVLREMSIGCVSLKENVTFDKIEFNFCTNDGCRMLSSNQQKHHKVCCRPDIVSVERFICEDSQFNISKITSCKCKQCEPLSKNHNAINLRNPTPFLRRKLLFFLDDTTQNVPNITLPSTSGSLPTNLCYVSVFVYEDLTLLKPLISPSVDIKAIVKEIDGSTTLGKASNKTLSNGHTCVLIYCDKLVYLYGEQSIGSRREKLFVGNPFLPFNTYTIETKDQGVKFESRNYGNAIDCNILGFGGNTTCVGPIFNFDERFKCYNINFQNNSFHYKFATFTKPRSHNFVAGDGRYDQKLSWYPDKPATSEFRSCFMKVRIDIQNTYDLRIKATSYLEDLSGQVFGYTDVGPVPDPRINDLTIRGACVEFRCAGLIKDGAVYIYDKATFVDVRLSTSNSSTKCSLRKTGSMVNVTAVTDSRNGVTGFTFAAPPGYNFGPRYGVFIYNAPTQDTENICSTGHTGAASLQGIMDPKMNPMVEIDCL